MRLFAGTHLAAILRFLEHFRDERRYSLRPAMAQESLDGLSVVTGNRKTIGVRDLLIRLVGGP